jgi:hypothetical protein
MSALPHFSDVDLLGYRKRIIDLNSQIADRTLDLRVAQQELNCSKVAGLSVDEWFKATLYGSNKSVAGKKKPHARILMRARRTSQYVGCGY